MVDSRSTCWRKLIRTARQQPQSLHSNAIVHSCPPRICVCVSLVDFFSYFLNARRREHNKFKTDLSQDCWWEQNGTSQSQPLARKSWEQTPTTGRRQRLERFWVGICAGQVIGILSFQAASLVQRLIPKRLLQATGWHCVQLRDLVDVAGWTSLCWIGWALKELQKTFSFLVFVNSALLRKTFVPQARGSRAWWGTHQQRTEKVSKTSSNPCLQAEDSSDEESVQIFKDYALGQLQNWIQQTVERSQAALQPSWRAPNSFLPRHDSMACGAAKQRLVRIEHVRHQKRPIAQDPEHGGFMIHRLLNSLWVPARDQNHLL